jgi:outer membrane lipoprotein-sorting protein
MRVVPAGTPLESQALILRGFHPARMCVQGNKEDKTKRMRVLGKLASVLSIVVLLLPASTGFAADDLNAVLAQLDAAAARFRSTAADFEFDSITTDPIPDKDVQKGTVYYERKGSSFQMAAHIKTVNGKPVPKMYVYSNGELRLDEPMIDQVTTIKKMSQYESYLMLGFGASGKELADKWNITDDGAETIDGVKTEKLELVAKDPAVRKNLPKVTIWVDPERGVSLKQVFDEGPGQYRVCTYSNFKLNQSLPGDAFSLKTDSKTQYVTR